MQIHGAKLIHYFEYPNFASTSLLISIRGEAKIMLSDEARSNIT